MTYKEVDLGKVYANLSTSDAGVLKYGHTRCRLKISIYCVDKRTEKW